MWPNIKVLRFQLTCRLHTVVLIVLYKLTKPVLRDCFHLPELILSYTVLPKYLNVSIYLHVLHMP